MPDGGLLGPFWVSIFFSTVESSSDLSPRDWQRKVLPVGAAAFPNSDAVVLDDTDLCEYLTHNPTTTETVLQLGPPANSMANSTHVTTYTYSADGCTFLRPITASFIERANVFDKASDGPSWDSDILLPN